MMEGILISTALAFIKLMSPVAAILALVLFLRPKSFFELEKKLSARFGAKKANRKTIRLLEKENMTLQNILMHYNRVAGFVIFVFSLIIIIRLYLQIRL